MAEQKIIAKTDIQGFWKVPNTVDDSFVNIAILEAQQSDLKRVLGEQLYFAFVEDYNGTTFNTAIYQTLYDGGSYTYQSQSVYFSGIKQLICAYSFIQLVKNSKISVVRSGVVVKTIEQSETAENFEVRSTSRKAFDQSGRLEAEVMRFLYENRSAYPLYLKKVNETQKRTGFNFYKV